MEKKRIAVVGAGSAGMMAAIRASQLGAEVILFEKNPALGKKLLLSGKGRCNITNACDLDSFLQRFSGNGEFLRDAFRKFFNKELIRFFENRGLEFRIERQERVFPVTDKSSSVVNILKGELEKNRVKIGYDSEVKEVLIKDNRAQGLLLKGGKEFYTDKIILATGGISYSYTGSDGFGINAARKSGHRIVPLEAGLVPLEIKQHYPKLLEGLTLKNIRLKISDSKKQIISPVGELLFTSSGVSGPLVFSLSAKIGDWLKKNNRLFLEIDLKPGLSYEQLDQRLLREFKSNPRKNIKNTLKSLLPQRLINIFIAALHIEPHKLVSYITQDERKAVVSLVKGFHLDIKGLRPVEEAMVTRGGVSLRDINPRTMESKVIKGLYFAGEMIDLDADTGGFNLQAAFSTGYLAGESAAVSQ